jgi:hypothetical protein
MQRRFALLALSVAALLRPDGARAGVWGADPTVAVSGDYASNPGLLDIAHTSQTDAAVLVDSPVAYNADAFKLTLLPSVRVADTRSYSSLNSDYLHFTASGELSSELNKWSATVGATRDSSLYQNYLSNGAAGVRRDGLTGDLTWTRHLTELLDADLDLNTVRVRYGAPVGNPSLVDYRYSAVAPDLAWNLSERGRMTLSASGGQYDSLDGTTRSRNYGGQLGYGYSLNEIWFVNASAGYTRSQNRLDGQLPEFVFNGTGYVLVDVPFRVESQRGSAVYSVHLARTGPRLTLNLSATRQEVPTGFAFLSRQTLLDVQATYAISARWTAGLHEYRLASQDPSLQGQVTDRNLNYLTLNTSRQLTEHWTLDVALSRVTERYVSTGLGLTSNQITLTLTRSFNHISLQ